MGPFDRTAKRLAKCPAVLFPADPGDAMNDLLRLYDPAMRASRDRFVFSNGVLLYGPIDVTPQLARKARLPDGLAVIYYASTAIQPHKARRTPEITRRDAGRLVRGIAARLRGTVHPQLPEPDLALLATVYAPKPVSAADVITLLRPYTPALRAYGSDAGDESFTLACDETRILVGHTTTPASLGQYEPPAVGELREAQHHEYVITTNVPASEASRELATRLGGAALALARHADGVAADMYGFRLSRPEELLPR